MTGSQNMLDLFLMNCSRGGAQMLKMHLMLRWLLLPLFQSCAKAFLSYQPILLKLRMSFPRLKI